MSTVDVFRMTDQLEEETLQVIVKRLESRGAHWFFQTAIRDYLDAINIQRATDVLDIGCGTGVAARAVARHPDFSGTVTGIDLSPVLVQAAERLAQEEQLGDRIQFQPGDTNNLAFPNDSFDVVIAHTVVSHVSDPLRVLNEVARVTRPGGSICVFDGDYASLTFAVDDPEDGKLYDEKLRNAIVTSPYVMRQMPRLLRTAKLEIVQSMPYVMTEIAVADYWLGGIESFSKLIPQSGAMSEEEAVQWAAELKRSSDEGIFFGSSNFYTYILKKPV